MKSRIIWGKSISSVAFLLLVCCTLFITWKPVGSDGPRVEGGLNGESSWETVVVARMDDPYYPLAKKIAKADQLEIVEDVTEAMKLKPKYIILVASPEKISGDLLLEIGRAFQSAGDYPALGMITGGSIKKAEQLWSRRGLARQGRNYVGGDIEVTQRVWGPTIFNISRGALEEDVELNKTNLIAVLKQADYFYWARHVGGKTWFWNSEAEDFGDDDQLIASDLPELGPIVIYTPSCNSFRPWIDGSIALGFVDHGAAAYLGDTISPYTNAFIKRGLAVPGISSWEAFPLGLVAQVHSKMMTRAFFTQPQFFMLGDPRISLSKEMPYRVVSDTVMENGKRVITGESDYAGVLAIKIADGAAYDFLAVKGATAASEHDLFYNSKLQTMNLGADKYVLLLHPGGTFEIELSRTAPFGWVIGDGFVDALDYAWVLLRLDEKIIISRYLYLIPVALLAGLLGFKLARQKRSLRDYWLVFLGGFLATSIRMAYALLRADAYTVSANFVDYYTVEQIALGFLGEWAGFSLGLILMRDTRKTAGKMVGLILAVFPQFMLTVFYLGMITLLNVAAPMTGMNAPWLLNYSLCWMLIIALVTEMAMVLAVFRAARIRAGQPA